MMALKIRSMKFLLLFLPQSGRQPLHWACSGGHVSVVEYLCVDCSLQDVDVRDGVSLHSSV